MGQLKQMIYDYVKNKSKYILVLLFLRQFLPLGFGYFSFDILFV